MPLSIWMVAAEAAPLAETGGLGEVMRTLPAALAQRGLVVRRFLPAYGFVPRDGFQPEGPAFAVRLVDESLTVRLLSRPEAAGLVTTLVECDAMFERKGIYGEGGVDYPDNGGRFALFCRAVCEAANRMPPPDVLHAHDWPAGPATLLARLGRAGATARTVYTVHNLPYLGNFAPVALDWLGLSDDEKARVFRPIEGIEFYGSASYTKAGLVYADRITTVSPTHATEIQTPEFGAGLDGLLRERAGVVSGILHGVDYESWDPSRDPVLPQSYDIATVAHGKKAAHRRLREVMAMPPSRRPILAFLGRLAGQKGVDVVLQAIPDLLTHGCDLVFLGDGAPDLASRLRAAHELFPDRVAVRIGYDQKLARLILAGSELVLLPSRYEACGLTQMYAMRYGTLPIAHATGGLCDTIRDADGTQDGTGFLFAPMTAANLSTAVGRALSWRARSSAWQSLRQRAMREEFSWDKAAEAYEALYASIVGRGAH